MAVLAVAGTIACAAWSGSKAAAGFAAGAGISSASFYLLHRLTRDIGSAAAGGKVSAMSAVAHSFRLLILGGAVYVIVRVYEVSVPALAAGLLVAVAAATLEAIYELIYAP